MTKWDVALMQRELYSPDQPRVPAGDPSGGQFAPAGGGGGPQPGPTEIVEKVKNAAAHVAVGLGLMGLAALLRTGVVVARVVHAGPGGPKMEPPVPVTPSWNLLGRTPTVEEKGDWNLITANLEMYWKKMGPEWEPSWIDRASGTRKWEPSVQQVQDWAEVVKADWKLKNQFGKTEEAKKTMQTVAQTLQAQGFTPEQTVKITNALGMKGKLFSTDTVHRGVVGQGLTTVSAGPAATGKLVTRQWKERYILDPVASERAEKVEVSVRQGLAAIPASHWALMTETQVEKTRPDYPSEVRISKPSLVGVAIRDDVESDQYFVSNPTVAGYYTPSDTREIATLKGQGAPGAIMVASQRVNANYAGVLAAHEVGHAFHAKLKDLRAPSNVIYESAVPNQVTQYGMKNKEEAFAEAYSMYMSPTGRAYMQIKYPQTHEYMRRVFESPREQWLLAGEILKKNPKGGYDVWRFGKKVDLSSDPSRYPERPAVPLRDEGGAAPLRIAAHEVYPWDAAMIALADDDVAAILTPSGRVFALYSPDQPRDEQGMWTVGGSGPSFGPDIQKAAQVAATAIIEGGRQEAERLTTIWKKQKFSIGTKQVEQIAAFGEANAARVAVQNAAIPLLSQRASIPIVRDIPMRWGQSANHHESELVKVGAFDVFGGGRMYDVTKGAVIDTPKAVAGVAAYALDKVGTAPRTLNPEQQTAIRRDMGTFVKVQYVVTQARLKAQGIPDMVTLYRGVDEGSEAWKAGDTVNLELGTVSSFSDTPDVANGFGPRTVKISVPRSAIFANWRTGMGLKEEGEWLVLGDTKPVHATVIRSVPNAAFPFKTKDDV